MTRLSIIGLGKLGLCLAACYAERGFEVLGVDLEQRVVDHVNAGTAPWFEPGLDELLARHGGKRLRATTSHQRAIDETEVTIVLVATPSNPDGSFSNRFVEAALRSLGEAFRRSEKSYHLFVISSTVMPGSVEGSFIPILEETSGRKCGVGFDVCYDPDFVALGNVIKGFLRPDLVVIGESSPAAGERVAALHRQLCENNPAISRMSIISAEVAKVCLNAYITLKISFANSVANLCEHLPGADVDAITRAIGADRRISPYYFQGGPSYGGTCFPRDTRAYLTLAERLGVQAELVRAVEQVNRYQDAHLAAVVREALAAHSAERRTVGILGLAFTANTPVVTESPAIKLIPALLADDVRVVAYDRLAIDNARVIFGSAVEYASSAAACLAEADVVVLTLRDQELVDALMHYSDGRRRIVVDCWRQLDPQHMPEALTVVALGRYGNKR
ncbi:MAG: nucleotide sugar dehydrogenase [Chloroflexota bacterium]|nr:nucleotide sugar dehydrogenase [Dehalococcoidia bacterium]MDW8252656.1 nucleotide sugar dehydrogenase [Chloroflexota bacterium]